jgi:hypothetical protein
MLTQQLPAPGVCERTYDAVTRSVE